MFVENGLKKDPDNSGWVLGWGVVRSAPWHLAGVYGSKEAAEMKAAELGDGYSRPSVYHEPKDSGLLWEASR